MRSAEVGGSAGTGAGEAFATIANSAADYGHRSTCGKPRFLPFPQEGPQGGTLLPLD